MPYQTFAEIIEQVERDFGVSIDLSPPVDTSGLPAPLRPLYEYSNGLELPFAFINKATDCTRDTDPGWVNFGFDYYFSYFLCHESNRPAFTTWDHEMDARIEGAWDTALEWLVAEYEEFIALDTNENSLNVTACPATVSKTDVIAELKHVSDKSTPELLGLIRSGRFVIENIVRSDAFRVTRALQDLGVSCHVECDN